jgi:hypothetical protein
MGISWWKRPDWWAAIGTIAAVIIALFNERIQRWLLRPKLRLSYWADTRCQYTESRGPQSGDPPHTRRCLRIEVLNQGKSNAVGVEVFARQLRSQESDGTFSDEPTFVPANLLWASTDEMTQTITPKIPKYFNLCHIIGPQQDSLDEQLGSVVGTTKQDLYFDLGVHRQPLRATPGTYIVELVLGAGNVRATRWCIRVSYNGTWPRDGVTWTRDILQIEIEELTERRRILARLLDLIQRLRPGASGARERVRGGGTRRPPWIARCVIMGWDAYHDPIEPNRVG